MQLDAVAPPIDILPMEWLGAEVVAAATLAVVLDAAMLDMDMVIEVLMMGSLREKRGRR